MTEWTNASCRKNVEVTLQTKALEPTSLLYKLLRHECQLSLYPEHNLLRLRCPDKKSMPFRFSLSTSESGGLETVVSHQTSWRESMYADSHAPATPRVLSNALLNTECLVYVEFPVIVC